MRLLPVHVDLRLASKREVLINWRTYIHVDLARIGGSAAG